MKNIKVKGYTVIDVLNAGYTLEPMVCLKCGSNEVTHNQYMCDAYCAECGTWQIDYAKEKNII